VNQQDYEKGFREGFEAGKTVLTIKVEIDPSLVLGKTMTAKFDVLVKRFSAEFDMLVRREGYRRMEEVFKPGYLERQNKLQQMLDRPKPLTFEEYRTLQKSLHPDSSSDETRKEAWLLITEKAKALRSEEQQRLRSTTPPLPETIEELMATRTYKGR
jgi:hypothetical protein